MKTVATTHTGLLLYVILPLFVVLTAASLPDTHTASATLEGAWEMVSYNGETQSMQTVQIFSRNYFMSTEYDRSSKVFSRSMGGFYEVAGSKLTLSVDYHTRDTSMVGESFSFKLKFEADGILTMKGKFRDEKITVVWKRLDNGDAPLAGAWMIGRRMGQTGEMREMTPGPRKTVKILSGTRFQWTAMNTETKEFFGTGGGTYTLQDGVYTENIEFFSRDSSRVGASLSFEGKVEGDEWHHSGQSSRGAPINEVWIRQ